MDRQPVRARSLESKGDFYIADEWKLAGNSRFFRTNVPNDYHVPDQALSYNYISETTSTVYLTGQGDRGYFDLRGYSFEAYEPHIQAQQPIAHPV